MFGERLDEPGTAATTLEAEGVSNANSLNPESPRRPALIVHGFQEPFGLRPPGYRRVELLPDPGGNLCGHGGAQGGSKTIAALEERFQKVQFVQSNG